MYGIVVEVGKLFPPLSLSMRQDQLCLEVLKTFMICDQSELLSYKFILPFHESFQDHYGLMFMCAIAVLHINELLQKKSGWVTMFPVFALSIDGTNSSFGAISNDPNQFISTKVNWL